MSQFTQLFAVAALAGGLAVVGMQPASETPKPAQVSGVAKPSPPIRSSEHRKVHRPAPKVARQSKREWKAIPGVRPIPPIAKEEKRRERVKVKKQRAAAVQQRRPTADECAQMRSAGRALVTAGGRLRGYSDDQINRALRDCGL
jgi:hypothetical protein